MHALFAFAYLILAFALGTALLGWILPDLKTWDALFTKRKPGGRPQWFRVYLATAVLVGTLTLAWATYLGACWFHASAAPLLYGNIAASVLALAFLGLAWRRHRANGLSLYRAAQSTLRQKNRQDLVFSSACFLLCAFLMTYTFRSHMNELLLGGTTGGDLRFQLSLIRSFSQGSNFPAQYTPFADGNMRYDFLFPFFVGNLEFLGLPLVWAMNLPSIFSMFFLLWLLCEFAVLLTSDRRIGMIACILFLFRSSFSFFTEMWNQRSLAAPFSTFLGSTKGEHEGIWSLNAFVTQRHFAYSLALLLVVLTAIVVRCSLTASVAAPAKKKKKAPPPSAQVFPWQILGLGVLIGLLGFWNGAVALAGIGILGVFAFHTRFRWEILAAAALALVLVLVESRVFTGQLETLLQWDFGRVAGDGNVAWFFWRVLGALPLVAAVGLVRYAPGLRPWAAAFAVPLVAAFTFFCSRDLDANHKFLVVAVLFFNIVAATVLVRIPRAAAIALAVLLTCTGVAEFVSLVRLNAPAKATRYSSENALMNWIREKTPRDAVWASNEKTFGPLVMTGRRLFMGGVENAEQFGYSPDSRRRAHEKIFNMGDPRDLVSQVRAQPMDFIAVTPTLEKGRAEVIHRALPLVYEDLDLKIRVYKARNDSRALASIPTLSKKAMNLGPMPGTGKGGRGGGGRAPAAAAGGCGPR